MLVHGAGRWPGRGRRAGRGHRLPRRGHADPDGLRVRGQPRRHVPLPDGGLRTRPRRGQDRPLLRGEPGPLRLARGTGRPFRPDVLRRDLHGADRAPRASCTRGARTPTRSTRSPGPLPAGTWPRRSGRPDGCSCSTWRPPPPTPAPPSRPTPGWTGWWSTTDGSSGVQAQRFGETVSLRARRGVVAHRRRVHLQRRHAAPALPAPGARHVQGRHRGRRRAGHPHGAGHRAPRCATCTPARCRSRSRRRAR